MFYDNLLEFLQDKNQSDPVTYGYDLKGEEFNITGVYHQGGAGYLLSKEAFKRIGSALETNYSFCPNSGIEDVDIAICLRKLGVYPKPSLDEHGRERFHAHSAKNHYKGTNPDWLIRMAANPLKKVS